MGRLIREGQTGNVKGSPVSRGSRDADDSPISTRFALTPTSTNLPESH